jgi:hypothetical protein
MYGMIEAPLLARLRNLDATSHLNIYPRIGPRACADPWLEEGFDRSSVLANVELTPTLPLAPIKETTLTFKPTVARLVVD